MGVDIHFCCAPLDGLLQFAAITRYATKLMPCQFCFVVIYFLKTKRIDRELEDVLKKIDPVLFRNSYFTTNLNATNTTLAAKKAESMKADVTESSLTYVDNETPYIATMNLVLKGIKNKDYNTIQNLLTTEGNDIFTKLVNYGNAKTVGSPELTYIKFDQSVICQSVPMSFNF